MEGKRYSSERRVTRCYQANRIEDELWAMAYEQIWPLLRRRLNHDRAAPTGSEQSVRELVATVRRA